MHSASDPNGAESRPVGPSRDRPGWKGSAGLVGRCVVVPYLFVAIMLGAFQRSLIYYPMTEPALLPERAGLPAGTLHAVALTTGDGLKLNGWHVPAHARPATTRDECDRLLAAGGPLVLYFPGNGGNRSHRADDLLALARLGADVVLFDYRGYGDNPGSPGCEALATDAWAVWKYLTEERNVAPERIVLFGESLGGGVATRLCAELCRAGTPPGGLILKSTFSSLADAAAWHYPWLPVRRLLCERFPSAELMPEVTCPVLQIHGGQDRIVPIELGGRLFAAVPARSAGGIPRRFVELPAAGHNDISVVQFRDAVGELLATAEQSTAPK